MKRFKSLGFLLFIFTFFLVGLSLPSLSHAQITGLGSSDDTLTISTNPAFPKPNDQVTVTIESFAVDLSSAKITWSLNGNVVTSGTGKTNYTFILGPLGTNAQIGISVVPANAPAFERTVAVAPSSIDFVWQADTYTPPFYKGKALFTGQATVVIAAVAELGNGQGETAPDKLLYRWKQGEDNAPDQSGSGKLGFTMVGNLWGRDDSATVDIATASGLLSAEDTINFSPMKPMLLIYENNPLLGTLYNHAVEGTFAMDKNGEVSFFAAPYYFLNGLLGGENTNYVWRMNGNDVSDQADANTVTFRADGSITGTSAVSVDTSQPRSPFQIAGTNFSINFK